MLSESISSAARSTLKQVLPASLLRSLQRLKLRVDLAKPYHRVPLTLDDVASCPASAPAYASLRDKRNPAYRKVMDKMRSFPGAGPIGPNKFWEYPWVLAELELEPGLRVLDAGCGRAPVQFALADLGLSVSAIDPFANMPWHGIDRRLAAKYGLDIDYRVEGMEKISYPDESFDRVISVSVLEHCRARPVDNEWTVAQTDEDRRLHAAMARELARVLRKGGLLLITLDIVFPRRGCLAAANIDVRNLIDATGLELVGGNHPLGVPGDPDFSLAALEASPELDIQDYQGILGTSLGLVFRK